MKQTEEEFDMIVLAGLGAQRDAARTGQRMRVVLDAGFCQTSEL